MHIVFPDGETLEGQDILTESIPEVYKMKMELIKASGIDAESAKLVVLFPHAFPKYFTYFGGAYVAS